MEDQAPAEPKGFFQRKTTWAALGTIGTAITGYITKTLDAGSALALLFQALTALGLRSAIAKVNETTSTNINPPTT